MQYFTSDTHFHHKNIVRGVSSWEEDGKNRKTRDFKTLYQHDIALVNAINSVVKEDDVLYHLGDWSFGGINEIWNFRKQLNCKEIHLIFGNHDQRIEAGNSYVIPVEDIEIAANLFEERFGLTESQRTINLQSLFTSVSYYKELKINGMHIILCHYAMRVWNKAHRDSIMLYGHSHGSLEDLGNKSIDVGVDTNNLKPYSLSNIQNIMSKRRIIKHH